MPQDQLVQLLYETYDKYKEVSITKRKFKNEDILPLIQKLKSGNIFQIRKAGVSVEKKEIYLISIGTGKTKILIWSQMHGDESTGTMALFDIFNFFLTDDNFNQLREKLLNETTIFFIPMLNPDGAEKFQRRNALHIDLNRDAIRLESPEAKILKSIRDNLNPQFGFNLHDQSKIYTAGKTFGSAAISFFAPAYNYADDINDVRKNTMKVIAKIYNAISPLIPGHIGRYDADFEPEAFGDNFVKWGTASILIESGNWNNDSEKQFIRKLNFIALLTAFNSIADKNYENIDIKDYYQIPKNEKLLFDKLFRNLFAEYRNEKYVIDIGVNIEENKIANDITYYYKSSIDDIGDLSGYFGYEEFDCSGMKVEPGKVYPEIFNSLEDIKKLDFQNLHEKGYLFVKMIDNSDVLEFTELPINILMGYKSIINKIDIDIPANFIIKKEDEIKYVILNGFIFDMNLKEGNIKNGLVFR